MRDFLLKLKKPLNNQKGITNMIVLLIVLPVFLCITVMVVTLFVFIMRQAKLDDIKDRALQMAQNAGYVSPAIIADTKTKLASLGYPTVTKGGVTYPSFTGSTSIKVGKFDVDPTVKIVVQYPASDLVKLMAFFGVTSNEDAGYFFLEAYGRSEEK